MSRDQPWMTALEMQLMALRITNQVVMHSDSHPEPGMWECCHDAHLFLRSCQPFAWNREATSAVVLASRTVPETTRWSPQMLPDGVRSSFWWFQEPVPLVTLFDGTHPVAIVVGAYGNGDLRIVIFRREMFPVGGLAVPLNVSLGAIVGDAETPGMNAKEAATIRKYLPIYRFVLAACAWLQQRIVVIGSGHIERHRRKQLARENKSGPILSDVKVIELRRTETQPRDPFLESQTVDWSCRWIVNGHWRNQVYANGEHKLIYIMPYVKGPGDKPLRVPTQTVYAVTR